MKRILLAALIVILFTGCTTQRTISRIENHAGNIEIKIDSESQKLVWDSAPGFEGETELPTIDKCDQTEYFVFGGLLRSSVNPLGNSFKTVDVKPVSEEKFKNFLTELDSCSLIFVEQRSCAGTCVLHAPVEIHAYNKDNKSRFFFVPEARQEIPIRDWPSVAFSAILDIPIAIVSLPWVLWHTATAS